MSMRAVSWALDQKGLTTSQKLVLVIIADYANQDDMCWPSQTVIAETCALSRQQVNKTVGQLEEKGRLNIISRRRSNGSDTSCCYELNLPDKQANAPANPPPAGFVYVVSFGGRTKIGITRSLDARMKALSALAADGDEFVVHKTYSMLMRQAREVERAVIARLSAFRLKGEWFACNPETMMALIDETQAVVGVVSFKATPPVSTPHDTPVSTPHDTQNQERKNLSFLEDSFLTQGVSEERSSGRWNFDAFWEQYPHKVGKRAAIKAFDAARKRKGSFVDLMLGLLRYASKTDDRPWCNPATWLNQDRWLDQPAAGGSNGRAKTLFEKNRELVAEFQAADRSGGDPAGSSALWPIPKRIEGR